MSSLLANLSELIKNREDDKIREILTKLLNETDNITLTSIADWEKLLVWNDIKILTLTIQFIADISKLERNRNRLTTATIIKNLLKQFNCKDNLLLVQVCRALGNICIDNDEARKIFGKEGLQSLLKFIKQAQIEDLKLFFVLCGLLLNLLTDNKELQISALDLDVVSVIEEVFVKKLHCFDESEYAFVHLLQVLYMMSEHWGEMKISSNLCKLLIDMLKLSGNPELSILCLEILHGQSEHNEVKLCLARLGTCELVYKLVKTHREHVDDKESRDALKMACELIVLVLTEDEAMDMLYNHGKGQVYKDMLSWLDSDDIDLLSTGVLAIGNFARNDTHCIQMVQEGTGKRLLDLLSKHNSLEEDIKLQHALLSALRNLVIPLQNKAQILNEGLVDILYPMLNVGHPPVVFKLLGTLRMAIDGQEKAALDLISRPNFLDKLSEWCYNSDHLGVRGEAPRLLAWLIKNCHSFKPFPSILSSKGCIRCLVEMIPSNHAVMQNEAFFALTILSTYYIPPNNENDHSGVNNEFVSILVNANIGKNIVFILNKYKDKMEKETIENLLTLIENVCRSTDIVQHMKTAELNIEKLVCNKNSAAVTERITKLATIINITNFEQHYNV